MRWKTESDAQRVRRLNGYQRKFALFPTIVAIDTDRGKHVWAWLEDYEICYLPKPRRRLPGHPEYRDYDIPPPNSTGTGY
jgi:hypothetical protein